MSDDQLQSMMKYNLDYLEGNIDFEEEYKDLAESYSRLYSRMELLLSSISSIREYFREYDEIMGTSFLEEVNKRVSGDEGE